MDHLRISLSEGGISDKHRLMSTYVRLWVSHDEICACARFASRCETNGPVDCACTLSLN
jgi:hypothetical protein